MARGIIQRGWTQQGETITSHWKEACWMVWLLACTRSPHSDIIYSLNGYFCSSSKQKLGEGLAKLRTAREAPSDCMCPPGRCKRTGTANARLPGSRLLAGLTPPNSSSPILNIPPYQGKRAKKWLFPSWSTLLCLRLLLLPLPCFGLFTDKGVWGLDKRDVWL